MTTEYRQGDGEVVILRKILDILNAGGGGGGGGGGGSYTLPAASAGTRGGVKVGSRLSIVGDVLSADVQTPSPLLSGHLTYVDAVNGSDGSGQAGSLSKPFLTLEAALAATASGSTIIVRPGAYTPLGNLAKQGVAWFFEPGTTITYAPVSLTHSLFDLTGGLTMLRVEGYGQFVLSPSGTPDATKFTLFSDAGAGAVTQFIFEADSVVDTTGLQCSGVYGSASDVLNLRFKLLDAALNVHAVRSPVHIGRLVNRYGAINGVTFTLSAITTIDVYLQTGTPTGSYPLTLGEYCQIGNVELGSFELHEVHFKVLRQLVESNILNQVKVTQGPCVIEAYLTTFNGASPGVPLVIATTDPVTFDGVIDMKDVNYAFPIEVSGSFGACTLKTNGACLMQNADPAGNALRTAIFGVATPYAIFCAAGSTLSVIKEGPLFTNQNPDANVTFLPTFQDIGSPLTTNTGTSLTLDGTMETVTLNNASPVAVSLPALVNKLKRAPYRIKNLGAGIVTITPNGPETIFTNTAVASIQLATGDSVDLTATPAFWLAQ